MPLSLNEFNPYNNAGLIDPLANAQRGALATAYGIPQIQMDQRDQDLRYNNDSLTYQNNQLDMPLKDLERQVKMGDQDILKSVQDSGLARQAATSKVQTQLAQDQVQQEHAKLVTRINQADDAQAASFEIGELQKKGGLALQSAWPELVQRYAARGVKLPPAPDLQGIDAFTRQAEAAKAFQPRWQQRADKLAEIAATGAYHENVARIGAQGHVDAATAMAGIQRQLIDARKPTDERVKAEIDRIIADPEATISKETILRAYSALDKDPEKSGEIADAVKSARNVLQGTPDKESEKLKVVKKWKLPDEYAKKSDEEIISAYRQKLREDSIREWAQSRFAKATTIPGKLEPEAAAFLGVKPTQQTKPAAKPTTVTPSQPGATIQRWTADGKVIEVRNGRVGIRSPKPGEVPPQSATPTSQKPTAQIGPVTLGDDDPRNSMGGGGAGVQVVRNIGQGIRSDNNASGG